MTIPKHAGLSRLAEATSPVEYYPVKRRGQRRRLVPNWDAINWLEDETYDDTEISSEAPLEDGMIRLVALGWFSAKRRNMYPRRMFDIFELEASSTGLVTYTPCEACDDFSRTWACTEHPEVAWDTRRRVWVRPGTPIWCELHPEDRPEPQVEPEPYIPAEARVRGANGLYDWMIEMFGQPLPSPGFTVRQADQEAYRRQAALYFQEIRPSDPNAGRPGYHYHFPTDRWVPDTDDALAPRRSILDALPDISATTFTLEITSDTTEASARSVRIEVERDGDTTP